MLKPKYLETLPDRLVELYSQVETDILCDMARRISAFDDFIPAAQWQYQKLIEMGNYHSFIVKALAAHTGETEKHIQQLMNEAGMKTLAFDDAVYKAAGLAPPSLSASPALQAALADGLRSTMGLFENLTRTTANTATGQFERALDRAWLQVQSGAFSPQQAITMAIKDLCEQGVGGKAGTPTVRYPTGHIDKLDVCVRRAVLTGVNQAALRLQIARMDEMGCDLVEVSAHAGARVGDGTPGPGNHAWWQGKVYSRSGTSGKYPAFVECTGYGTGEGLGGWNCRHSFFPFYEGFSEPAYTEEALEELNAPKYAYNGRKLTEYEATQRQRYIERQIRRWKREKAAMEAAGLDSSEASAKLRQWRGKMKDFLDQTGLKRHYEREYVEETAGTPPAATPAAQGGTKAPDMGTGASGAGKPAEGAQRLSSTEVTQEYQQSATPGEGAISYEDGYSPKQHEDEIAAAHWLRKMLGGDIRLLNETSEKRADYLWRGKLWDLKGPSTEKAANSAIRKGLQQIRDNPGGVILDYRGQRIDPDLLRNYIEKRMAWYEGAATIDILIIYDDDRIEVWRFKKK